MFKPRFVKNYRVCRELFFNIRNNLFIGELGFIENSEKAGVNIFLPV